MKRVDNDSEMIVRRHNHGLELRSVKHSTILAFPRSSQIIGRQHTSMGSKLPIEICAADVGNAYLNAPTREKLWTVAAQEFGSNRGKVMLVVKALYGTKSAGASWHTMLAGTMRDLSSGPHVPILTCGFVPW